jgi:NADPH-dependent 2,4-dienoyl-CoA reductase/sulfur reductase-like enzyme
MSTHAAVDALVQEFKTSGRIVIVGASLAGLRAAEAVRDEGFSGQLTIIGDEPYDRPLLSKQVLTGVPAEHTKLPRVRAIDADWRLGMAATGLDRAAKQVRLANGEQVPFDRLLIAIGTRAWPWFNGTVALRRKGVLAMLKNRKEVPSGPRRTVTKRASEGLLRSFWASGWTSSSGPIAQCNSAKD